MIREPARQIAALLVVIPLSCSGYPVSPEGVAGMYVLEEINGNRVPAVTIAHDFGSTEIVADTLWLEANGSGRRHVTYRSTGAGGEWKTYRSEEPFAYALTGTRIEIGFECRDVIIYERSVELASCIAPPHFVGRVEGDGMRGEGLHQNRLRYRRL